MRLASSADAILLDLHGFTRTNEGSTFELAYLVQHTDLLRTVLLVDSTTDMRSLEYVAQFAWTNQPYNSPNAQKRRPELIALNFETLSEAATRALFGLFVTCCIAGSHLIFYSGLNQCTYKLAWNLCNYVIERGIKREESSCRKE